HLRSEPFWHLVAKPGRQLFVNRTKSISSFKTLSESIAYAELDRELFLLLQEIPNQFWFEQLLIDHYFPNSQNLYRRPAKNYEEEKIENEILNEPKEEYQLQIQMLKDTLQEDEFEEEIFVRGGL